MTKDCSDELHSIILSPYVFKQIVYLLRKSDVFSLNCRNIVRDTSQRQIRVLPVRARMAVVARRSAVRNLHVPALLAGLDSTVAEVILCL